MRLLLAVSAGSDSVALLHIVYSLKEKLKLSLSVVTVNHNIRGNGESERDACFVKNMCKTSFSEEVPCLVVEIPTNKIKQLSLQRGKGIEEAARFLRYQAFNEACEFFSADYILTAHTKNDFYEGVLMSIFRGASPRAILGMRERRGCIVRPLLNIEKQTLRNYLLENKIEWMEDSTNQDPSYLRNSVRINLIPALEKTFFGWQGGVEKTLKRLAIDEEYVEFLYKTFIKTNPYWKRSGEGKIYIEKNIFVSMPKAFKIRFLQDGFLLLGVKTRVSYFAICSLMNLAKNKDEVSCGNIKIYVKDEKVILTYAKNNFDAPFVNTGYMFWVEKTTKISIQGCELFVNLKAEGLYISSEEEGERGIGPFKSPVCIRSRLPGDVIKIAGRIKTLKSVFSKYLIPSKISSILPIVEEGGVVRAVYGKALGAKNFIGDTQ